MWNPDKYISASRASREAFSNCFRLKILALKCFGLATSAAANISIFGSLMSARNSSEVFATFSMTSLGSTSTMPFLIVEERAHKWWANSCLISKDSLATFLTAAKRFRSSLVSRRLSADHRIDSRAESAFTERYIATPIDTSTLSAVARICPECTSISEHIAITSSAIALNSGKSLVTSLLILSSSVGIFLGAGPGIR